MSVQRGQGQHGQGRGGLNKLDMMKEDQHEQSERFSEQDRRNYVIIIAELILTLCSFFQENKSNGIKKPFALILCLPHCTSRREHSLC
jgi:hypothetical protein